MAGEMKVLRIREFGVVQTAKIFAAIYFLGSACIAIPAALVMAINPLNEAGWGPGRALVIFLLPIFYGIAGFVVICLGCWIYNCVSRLTGGIEIKIDEV